MPLIIDSLMNYISARISKPEVDHFKNRDLKKPAKELMSQLMHYNAREGDEADYLSWNENHNKRIYLSE